MYVVHLQIKVNTEKSMKYLNILLKERIHSIQLYLLEFPDEEMVHKK